MRPFLLLSTRAEDAAAEGEWDAMRRFGGLAPAQLVGVRLERDALGAIELDAWSGVLLSGSPFTYSDPPETKSLAQQRAEAELLALIDRVVDADFPFLGCCYGIGLLGAHLGATIDRKYAEPVGPVRVRLTRAARADPLLDGVPGEFDAFVGHKEAISHLPPPAVLLASSAGCPVQLFRVGAHVYATQFHPELDVAGICTRIDVYKHHGYFAPETAEALKAQMKQSTVLHPTRILRNFTARYAR